MRLKIDYLEKDREIILFLQKFIDGRSATISSADSIYCFISHLKFGLYFLYVSNLRTYIYNNCINNS